MSNENQHEPDALYAGEVIDQLLTTGKFGEVQLVLTVSVTAQLTDEKAPTESAVACPKQEAEVWLSFSETEDDRLRMSLRHLERLGFHEVDLSRLHPQHPECHLLVGSKVHLRAKVFNGLTYWNLAWPRERPKQVDLGAIKGATAALASRIAAIRAKKSKGGAGTTTDRNTTEGEE